MSPFWRSKRVLGGSPCLKGLMTKSNNDFTSKTIAEKNNGVSFDTKLFHSLTNFTELNNLKKLGLNQELAAQVFLSEKHLSLMQSLHMIH